ncbi:ankyrin repeat domain-containing protein [Deinococcus wulumuqiensis]
MVRLLLDHGADVESRGPTGRTALMFAAMFERLDIMELLVERGADLRARDEAGTTPLDAARTMNAQEAVRWLEQRLAADPA